MYKNTIRELVQNATNEQLLLLFITFIQDEKDNTVIIHKLSNKFTQFYTMPVIHHRQMYDNGIEKLLYLLMQDGLIKNCSALDGNELVEVEIETDYYLIPDILEKMINEINNEKSYFQTLRYKKDKNSGQSYIMNDKLEIKLRISEETILKKTNLKLDESGKLLNWFLTALYENFQDNFESLIFGANRQSFVMCDQENHCLNIDFIYRDYSIKHQLKATVISELKNRGIDIPNLKYNSFNMNIYSLEDFEKQLSLNLQCQKIEYEKQHYQDALHWLYKAGVIAESLQKNHPDNYTYSFALANIKNNIAVLYLMCEDFASVFDGVLISSHSFIPLKRRIAHMNVLSDEGKTMQFKPYLYEIKKENCVNSLDDVELNKIQEMFREALQLSVGKDMESEKIIRRNLLVVEDLIN